MASQITSKLDVCSKICSGQRKRKENAKPQQRSGDVEIVYLLSRDDKG